MKKLTLFLVVLNLLSVSFAFDNDCSLNGKKTNMLKSAEIEFNFWDQWFNSEASDQLELPLDPPNFAIKTLPIGFFNKDNHDLNLILVCNHVNIDNGINALTLGVKDSKGKCWLIILHDNQLNMIPFKDLRFIGAILKNNSNDIKIFKPKVVGLDFDTFYLTIFEEKQKTSRAVFYGDVEFDEPLVTHFFSIIRKFAYFEVGYQ